MQRNGTPLESTPIFYSQHRRTEPYTREAHTAPKARAILLNSAVTLVDVDCLYDSG